MARSILSTALRLKDTQDALIFGKTLSQEERSELRVLIKLLRYFKEHVDTPLQAKIAFRIQFIHEAVEFSERQLKQPYNTIEEKFYNGFVKETKKEEV